MFTILRLPQVSMKKEEVIVVDERTSKSLTARTAFVAHLKNIFMLRRLQPAKFIYMRIKRKKKVSWTVRKNVHFFRVLHFMPRFRSVIPFICCVVWNSAKQILDSPLLMHLIFILFYLLLFVGFLGPEQLRLFCSMPLTLSTTILKYHVFNFHRAWSIFMCVQFGIHSSSSCFSMFKCSQNYAKNGKFANFCTNSNFARRRWQFNIQSMWGAWKWAENGNLNIKFRLT